MELSYKILPRYVLHSAERNGQTKHMWSKTLEDGSTMSYYIYTGEYQVLISIDEKLLGFREVKEGFDFYQRTKYAPLVKKEFEVRSHLLKQPVDLNYNLMTYEFFKSCRMARSDVFVTSDKILNDGRVSVIYSRLHYDRTNGVDDNFLVIGRMVFTHYRVEELMKLEDAINDGSATYWRPELSGTMDYIPRYGVSEYKDGRQKKFTTKGLYLKTCAMPGNTTATVYNRCQLNTRYYMRWHHMLYSFASLPDCELIISQLQGKSLQDKPAGMKGEYDSLTPSVKTIAARLSRYLTADITYSWRHSEALRISQTGSLTGLSAIM